MDKAFTSAKFVYQYGAGYGGDARFVPLLVENDRSHLLAIVHCRINHRLHDESVPECRGALLATRLLRSCRDIVKYWHVRAVVPSACLIAL